MRFIEAVGVVIRVIDKVLTNICLCFSCYHRINAGEFYLITTWIRHIRYIIRSYNLRIAGNGYHIACRQDSQSTRMEGHAVVALPFSTGYGDCV